MLTKHLWTVPNYLNLLIQIIFLLILLGIKWILWEKWNLNHACHITDTLAPQGINVPSLSHACDKEGCYPTKAWQGYVTFASHHLSHVCGNLRRQFCDKVEQRHFQIKKKKKKILMSIIYKYHKLYVKRVTMLHTQNVWPWCDHDVTMRNKRPCHGIFGPVCGIKNKPHQSLTCQSRVRVKSRSCHTWNYACVKLVSHLWHNGVSPFTLEIRRGIVWDPEVKIGKIPQFIL